MQSRMECNLNRPAPSEENLLSFPALITLNGLAILSFRVEQFAQAPFFVRSKFVGFGEPFSTTATSCVCERSL